MPRTDRRDRIAFGVLRKSLPSAGTLARRTLEAPAEGREFLVLTEIAERLEGRRERIFPYGVKAGGKKLAVVLDAKLDRWQKGAGGAVFELFARTLANEKAAPGIAQHLGAATPPIAIVLLDRSEHLVEVEPHGRLIGLNRVALGASRLSIPACLVAVALVHGLRAAARLRGSEGYDPRKEWTRDLQNFLVLLVGVQGTEWNTEGVRAEIEEMLEPGNSMVLLLPRYAERLKGSLRRRSTTRLDDRVFRDGSEFDRLTPSQKFDVLKAGTLAWYGVLTLGLLRLPRHFFAARNPYYETAWWILRAKPGGGGMFKPGLLRRAWSRIRSFRLLSGAEYLWSAWSPTLAVICLRPVYRAAGGNRRPFLATMATFAWTALVIHPLWITLTITGLAWVLGAFWPWIHTNTRLTSDENLILHAIVIGFWIGIGLIVATSKSIRRLLSRR